MALPRIATHNRFQFQFPSQLPELWSQFHLGSQAQALAAAGALSKLEAKIATAAMNAVAQQHPEHVRKMGGTKALQAGRRDVVLVLQALSRACQAYDLEGFDEGVLRPLEAQAYYHDFGPTLAATYRFVGQQLNAELPAADYAILAPYIQRMLSRLAPRPGSVALGERVAAQTDGVVGLLIDRLSRQHGNFLGRYPRARVKGRNDLRSVMADLAAAVRMEDCSVLDEGSLSLLYEVARSRQFAPEVMSCLYRGMHELVASRLNEREAKVVEPYLRRITGVLAPQPQRAACAERVADVADAVVSGVVKMIQGKHPVVTNRFEQFAITGRRDLRFVVQLASQAMLMEDGSYLVNYLLSYMRAVLAPLEFTEELMHDTYQGLIDGFASELAADGALLAPYLVLARDILGPATGKLVVVQEIEKAADAAAERASQAASTAHDSYARAIPGCQAKGAQDLRYLLGGLIDAVLTDDPELMLSTRVRPHRLDMDVLQVPLEFRQTAFDELRKELLGAVSGQAATAAEPALGAMVTEMVD